MRVLLTGANGFLGQWIQEKARDRFKIVPYDLPDDIRDREAFARALSDCDYVIHAAAVADLNQSEADPDLNFSVNIQGTEIVASECKKQGKRLAFISTCCVYGNSENNVPDPTELYAHSKLAGESIVKGHIPDALIFRIPTIFGPGMRPALFIYRIIDAIATGAPVSIHGDGFQTRQYGYVEDVASLICGNVAAGMVGTRNLNPPRAVSVMDCISIIARELKKPAFLEFGEDRKGQIYKQSISGGNLYLHQHSFEEGIRKTVRWYKSTKGGSEWLSHF